MSTLIDADVHSIEFDIFPSENRYEAYTCYLNKREKVQSGLLEHLLLHSVEIKALHSKGSNAKYKLKAPEGHGIKWFTKLILLRFLHIIGSANMADITNSVRSEISQLEEARKFHLSLYAKGIEYQLRTEESDDSYNMGTGSTQNADSSNASKIELLRAMELRLTALREELIAAFEQAAGSRYSVEEMSDVENFSDHFGSLDLRDSLRAYIEQRQGDRGVGRSSSKQIADNNIVKQEEDYNHAPNLISSEMPVKYGASPAKASQIERQSSTESDESSFSSEEDQSSGRSRALIRSASPKRSASPMRRVQIGRSGSRRSTAIAIKSLNYFPARERSLLCKDPAADDIEEEGSEQAPSISDANVRRMSVQDAISLFESKKKDHAVDIQTSRSFLNSSSAVNKSVLRKWSSGMREDSSQHPQDLVPEDAVPQNIANSSTEAVAENGGASDNPSGLDAILNSPEKRACNDVDTHEDTHPTEHTNFSDQLTSLAEWSRQKEAELSELLMKMTETKPARSRTVVPDRSKRTSMATDKRGALYERHKEKRDEKLGGEAAIRKPEKDKTFKAMEQIPVARKSKLDSTRTRRFDADKRNNVKKLQKCQNNASQPANSKIESPKLGDVKKVPKASLLPGTRKSLPSIPSPRTPKESPAKTSSSTSSAHSSKSSQPPARVSKSLKSRAKSVKPNQTDTKNSLRIATEKKLLSVTKSNKRLKSETENDLEDHASSAETTLYRKVTRKGSVVPLETKPYLSKGSGTIPSGNHFVGKKASSKPWGNKTASNSSEPLIMPKEMELRELEINMGVESGNSAEIPRKREEKGKFSQENPTINENPEVDDVIHKVVELESKPEAEEECTISPTACAEIEECEDEDQPVISSENTCLSPTNIAPAGVSNARVRHSLSQMILQESSEHDITDWGNAENPPPVVHQKDAPKGLKRLLKFARKSKSNSNAAEHCPSIILGGGEDDAEDSKFVTQENISKSSTGSSSQQQSDESRVTVSIIRTKATRSFFSLSAFKGSK